MPSLNFTSENGRPIAFIKTANKEFDKSIIYLHEENQGPQEINKHTRIHVFPAFRKGEG